MILSVVALLAWTILLTCDQFSIRREIDDLWDVLADMAVLLYEIAQTFRDHDLGRLDTTAEQLARAKEHLDRMEDDCK